MYLTSLNKDEPATILFDITFAQDIAVEFP